MVKKTLSPCTEILDQGEYYQHDYLIFEENPKDMISREQALAFAHEWVEAWNAHDLPRVLDHYTDDFEMSSPLMIQMGLSETGTLKGKQKIGDYWQKGLDKYPDLNFKLIDILSSVNSVIIYYHTINNKLSAEFFMFNEAGKVYKSIGHYN